MSEPTLYRGLWPQVIGKSAKYAVRNIDGEWKVTINYDIGEGLRYLAVDRGGKEIALAVNRIKMAVVGQEGGAFYINEYKHLLVPVKKKNTSHYYIAGKLDSGFDFDFDFEGHQLTTKPVDLDGNPLSSGDKWVGPRPGIPYVLAAGGKDIRYDTPALTDSNPPEVRENVTHIIQLSKLLNDQTLLAKAIQPILDIRGSQGGKFYVNEHSAIFTPVDRGDGDGLNYFYCGQIDLNAWFPEPQINGTNE